MIQKGSLLLCDTEEEYAELFGEYLRQQRELPWQIRVYTDIGELLEKEKKSETDMLVVSENAYCEEMQKLRAKQVVILNESGLIRWDKLRNVNKYQQANRVVRELLEIYVENAKLLLPPLQTDYGITFIGMYSPVRRCMQSTFALTMSQMLADAAPTLYLNLEHYAGVTELLPDRQTRDLSDLLYFLTAEKEKFRLRLQTMIQHKGKLDYIPPMKAGQNLLTVTPGEWISLLNRIGEMGEYRYVILDLSESIQGLFDILRLCGRVYTLTQSDRISQCKLMQYEELLAYQEYADVLEKTQKYSLPVIKRLPEELEQYTRGDLAEYVKRVVKELWIVSSDL